jgi:cell division protein FtsW
LTAASIPERLIRGLAYPAFLLLLTALLIGTVGASSHRPSLEALTRLPIPDFAPLVLTIWASHIYANKERRLGDIHQILVPAVPGFFIVIGLTLFNRDLSGALVLCAVLLGLLWAAGAPMRFFMLSYSMTAFWALAIAAASPERLARITAFTDPFEDYYDAGWQPAQGLYILANGGLLGQGIGSSEIARGYLPRAETHFIFAVVGEELGLMGSLVVIAMFTTIAYASLRVARLTANPFVRYLSVGLVVALTCQTAIHIGMVFSVLPVVGISLPLMSYGPGPILANMVGIGLLIGGARRESRIP